MNKKRIIVICGTLVAIIVGVIFFGNFFQQDPYKILIRATKKTMGEIKNPDTTLLDIYTQLKSDAWRQEVTFSVNKPDGSFLPEIDPRVLSVLEMVTLKHTARYDTKTWQRLDHIFAQIAVTPILEIEILSNANETALRVPQAFDYFISFNPRHVKQEWDDSLLGDSIGSIPENFLEDAFYEYYQQFLLPKQPSSSIKHDKWIKHIGLLHKGAEYKYMGDNLYSITVSQVALTDYWKAVHPTWDIHLPDDLIGVFMNGLINEINNMSFTQGLQVEIRLSKGKITELVLKTNINETDISVELNFKGDAVVLDYINMVLTAGDAAILASLTSDVGNPDIFVSKLAFSTDALDIEWDICWDKKQVVNDNFNANISIVNDDSIVNLNANGSLKMSGSGEYIEAQIKTAGIKIDTPEGDLSLRVNGRYAIQSDSEAIITDGKHRQLSQINEIDAALMVGKIVSHPQFGDLIKEYLPW